MRINYKLISWMQCCCGCIFILYLLSIDTFSLLYTFIQLFPFPYAIHKSKILPFMLLYTCTSKQVLSLIDAFYIHRHMAKLTGTHES